MSGESPCPDLDALERLALNQATPAEAFSLQRHLVKCVICAQTVQALKDASQVLSSMPASAGTPSSQASPAVGLDSRPTAPYPPPSSRPPPPLQRSGGETGQEFLAPPQGPDEMGRLGPYRVLKLVGTGGMGVVFKAEDPQLQRKVALKAMRPNLTDVASRQRFLQEARAAAAIEHDHIITVYAVGEDRGIPYLAMQFLQGETLADRIVRDKKLPALEIMRIGREVAEGLSAAHENGLIHRDIKPSNIWLESRSQGAGARNQPAAGRRPTEYTPARVKILDFGLARIAGEQPQHLTQTGFVVGTAGYIAPEQARGQATDGRCDLFSLGCVLYELCVGHPPFRGSDPMARLTALAVEQPPSPLQLNPDLPPRLAELVTWLLQKDPHQRPDSARVVVEELAALEHAENPPRPVADEFVGKNRPAPETIKDAAVPLNRSPHAPREESLTRSVRTTMPPPPAPAGLGTVVLLAFLVGVCGWLTFAFFFR